MSAAPAAAAARNGECADSSSSPSAPVYLFLDVDGVLNRIEADDDEFPDSDDEDSSSDSSASSDDDDDDAEPADEPCLPCVPSLESIQAAIVECELVESLGATLVRRLVTLLHAPCCAQSQSEAEATSVQIVLSSLWRLAPDNLRQLSSLLRRLGLVAREDDDDNEDDKDAAASCRFRPRPLLATPDLRGWGTRLEEILLFLQSDSSPHTPRFVAVDDQDLLAGATLEGCESKEQRRVLLDACRTRVVKLDGTAGLDAVSLRRALRVVRESPPVDEEFLRALAVWSQPTCPW